MCCMLFANLNKNEGIINALSAFYVSMIGGPLSSICQPQLVDFVLRSLEPCASCKTRESQMISHLDHQEGKCTRQKNCKVKNTIDIVKNNSFAHHMGEKKVPPHSTLEYPSGILGTPQN